MKYQYQLILLGTEVPQKEQIISKVIEKIEELGLSSDILKIIEAEDVPKKYLGNQPAFAIYFGDKNGKYKDIEVTENLLKDGTMILPIFFGDPADNSFSKEIPCVLSNQNGMQFETDEIDRISNLILESFELLRSTRKLFISYKRNESTSVAIQLYEALESYNYDVFLDTHSIKKGQPFQDELWHRMTDCDVILLLNTPGFLESQWCKEEFAEAGAKQIGVVQLVWPNHKVDKIDSSSHISYPVQLKKADFLNNVYDNKDESKLTDRTIQGIARRVEEIRARNLASRQDNLITDFKSIAEQCGRRVTVQPEGFLTENLPSGEKIIYLPTIGIPQSTSCQSAEIKYKLKRDSKLSVRLIYDDLRIRDNWLKHLDWLNENLKHDIRTLKKQDFELWLKKKN